MAATIPPRSDAETSPSHALVVDPGDAFGHALRIARARLEDAESRVALWPKEGALELLDLRSDAVVERDPAAIGRVLAPDLFPASTEHDALVERIAEELVGGARILGALDDQAAYEARFDAWKGAVGELHARLTDRRYLLGDRLAFADLLLFAFACRLDPVYATLFKANAFLLEDLPALHAFARDLYELPEVYAETDWDALVSVPHRTHETINPKGLVPRGGRPELHAPHFRHELSATTEAVDAATEEKQGAKRVKGEWVRGRSRFRATVPSDEHPVEAGRYHLFAPYNCPWSHRALLGRSVKGLEGVVGATILHFRRHPEHGWQTNPAIPGCTEDPVKGHRFVKAYYEAEDSKERSVPILYDTKAERIVNNESAEILRIFDGPLGDLGERSIVLYPAAHREAIDRVNEAVYQRINNGAYKAGFAGSQIAYERAFDRYFAGLRWVDRVLEGREWLVGSDTPTEADLRLFPTVFRHDAVYWARFRLNQARIRDYPRLARWLERMLAWPGVAEASNLDHARNGYFGRTGNEIVPAGPVPLGLSPKDFDREVWLGDRR